MLHICEGNSDVMALLITAPGANLALKNKDGKTAEQMARYSRNLGFIPSNTFTLRRGLRISFFVQGWQPQICVSFDPWHDGAASSWDVGLEGVDEEHTDGSGGSQDPRAWMSGDLKLIYLIFGFRCVLMRWLLRSRSSTASMATLCVDHAGLTFR